MKKNLSKKLQLNTETLRNLENLSHVAAGADETRAFSNCDYCYSTPRNCPTSIYTIDNNCPI
jgi:hypothetical protein